MLSETFHACPAALVDAEAGEALDLWAWAERGFLPKAGGVDDQLELDLRMIEIVDSVRSVVL